MAEIKYLESVLTQESKPATMDKENAPPLPALKPEQLGQLDLEKLIQSVKPGTPSPKKAWNRNVAVLGNSAIATSPSAASTQTPGAQTEAAMSASPCSSKGDQEEKEDKSELHAALQTLAEQYAAAKKANPSGPALCTALETVYAAAKAVLQPGGEPEAWESTEGHEERLTAVEASLRALAAPLIPVIDGEPTSIGSIPLFHNGPDACVGLCRFHVKGKCFDGALCRFCHISRDSHLRGGVLPTGRNAGRTPEKEDDPARRRGRKGRNSPSQYSPPKPHAPLAAPLLLPTPMPMMPVPMHMPMHMPVPMPMNPQQAPKPPTKEQSALCELLSSLDVAPEQRAPPAMPNPYAMPAMPNPYAMAHPMQMGYYDPSMAYGWGWPMQQPCPTVASVSSLQAMGRRKKGGK